MSRLVMRESTVGLLVVASNLKPIYANTEAIQILAYPETPKSMIPSEGFLADKIRSMFLADEKSVQPDFAAQFISGKRSYVCRPFSLKSPSTQTGAYPAFAVILERSSPKSLDAYQVAARFHLTQREQETLEYLMQGLTNKEIGHRMNISPNTVKAFLKLIMTKMGVSTRSGVIAKAVSPVSIAVGTSVIMRGSTKSVHPVRR